jgi:Thioredoxin
MFHVTTLPSIGTCVLLACATLSACQGESRSGAADVPATDVRRLPPERKEMAPDIMVQAADRGRVLGEPSAPVRMLVVSDYQCAECRSWFDQTLPVIRTEYVQTGKVRLTWVHYPLRTNTHAVRAASAAMCASAQSQFWEASTRLFGAQDRWATSPRADAVIDSLALVPGIEDYAFRNCVEAGRMLRQIRGDIDWTDTTRAGRPLMMVLGKRLLPGTTSLSALRAALDSALPGQ